MKKYDELHRLNAEATPGPWRYETQYGPEGEANYAWLYTANNELVGTFKTHHAAFIAAMRNDLPELLTKAEAHDALVAALKQADAAIHEFFRYWHGGETRGSYDGKPERDMLLKAGYATRAALAKLGGRDE